MVKLDRSPAGRDLVVRFQQARGPVMAKGVEDTTFYRWHELSSSNRRSSHRSSKPKAALSCSR